MDGVLVWANASHESGFGTNIFKIGIDLSAKVGSVSELNIDLDSVYLSVDKK